MSSGGVLVASQDDVSLGSRVEMKIDWPVLLDGRVPLQLIAAGRVVRCDTSSFATVLAGHQFRQVNDSDLGERDAFDILRLHIDSFT